MKIKLIASKAYEKSTKSSCIGTTGDSHSVFLLPPRRFWATGWSAKIWTATVAEVDGAFSLLQVARELPAIERDLKEEIEKWEEAWEKTFLVSWMNFSFRSKNNKQDRNVRQSSDFS